MIRDGREAFLPLSCCHIADEGWGWISHAHILRAGSPTPQTACFTVLPRRGARPTLLSPPADEGLVQFLRLPLVVRREGRRAFFPLLCYHMAGEGTGPVLSFSHTQGQLARVSINRVSSVMLPRQGAGPVFLSAAAGEGLVQFSLELQPVRGGPTPCSPIISASSRNSSHGHQHRPWVCQGLRHRLDPW